MRRPVLLLLALGLAGCGSGGDFDERYQDRSAALEQSARRMEQDMAQQLAQGQEADRAMGIAVTSDPAAPVESER